MELDLATTHGWLTTEFAARRPLRESMERIIDQCAAARAHPDWKKLRNLAYDDVSKLARWLRKPFRLEPPAEPVKGLWFGLFNPIYGAKTVADIYVCGSDRFEPDPNDSEWAVGPTWWPENRYAHSTILTEIYRIAYRKNGLGNDAEYPLCLGYGAFAVRHLLNTINPADFPDSVSGAGVAVGFDSGDFILLGRLTPDGLGPT
jgi:hypothetical protein